MASPVNPSKVIQWFLNNIGRLTYSMNGSRNGADGTADCSGGQTEALYQAGAAKYPYLYSTVTLDGYLAANGFERISVNQDWTAQAGDIILMSWGSDMRSSGGAGGHVGTMLDDINFISVDYWTGGLKGTAVSQHEWNYYYSVQKPNYIEVWRLTGNTVPKPAVPVPQPTPAQPQNDVDYMVASGYVKWNHKVFRVDDRSNYSGILQVVSRELSNIGTQPITDTLRHNNGVPMAAISWADGTPNSSTEGSTFRFDQDVMAIVGSDKATNGLLVVAAGYEVWVDATVARRA